MMTDAGNKSCEEPLILAVDDEKLQQRIMRTILSKKSYETIFAINGEEAIKQAEEHEPDVILLDIMMPGMNGFEVCNELQKSETTFNIPVIFVTALGDEKDRAKAFSVGATDYIVKPFSKSDLLDKVEKGLKLRRQWKNLQDMSRKDEPEDSGKYGFERFKKYLIEKIRMDAEQKRMLVETSVANIYAFGSLVGFTNREMAQHISEFYNLPYIEQINEKDVMLGVVPTPFCRANRMVPLQDLIKDIAFVLSNPFDLMLQDFFNAFSRQGKSYKMVIADPNVIADLFGYIDGSEKKRSLIKVLSDTFSRKTAPGVESEKDEQEGVTLEILAESANKAPVINTVNAILEKAISMGASDIHIEPREISLGVRYRVDGILYEQESIIKSMTPAIVSRIKIMSLMDIAERRLPQDGRIKVSHSGRKIDMRVSSIPARFGEKVVIRLLDSSAVSLDLEALGMEASALSAFKSSVLLPNGVILVTGPTGSGKSTTLYTALQSLNESHRNIMTVEDPVEYEVHRLTQVQVNPLVGLDFSKALRSFLRQDPDVIMVGEMRDKETMDIAMKAALTGHLVLSTLHTNDASSSVTRLINMGCDPYLVAESVRLIAAQRLVRKLCPGCKELLQTIKLKLERYDFKTDDSMRFYGHAGCSKCSHTGYKGRLMIEEVLTIDVQLKKLIVGGADSGLIREYATKNLGMKLLRETGLWKASRGLTSVDEVIRVTG